MRKVKKFSILAAVVLALSAIGAANSSAAQFTASATGEMTGKALNSQELTTNGGVIKCTKATPTGKINSVSFTELHVTIHFGGCTAFGFAAVETSPLTVLVTVTGQIHILNSFTIKVPLAGCTVTIGPQTISTIGLLTSGINKLKLIKNIVNIIYNSTGGLCGSSGENGKFVGNEEYERVGGGSLTYDP